jgi:hypothetical protein
MIIVPELVVCRNRLCGVFCVIGSLGDAILFLGSLLCDWYVPFFYPVVGF